jgi:DNA helicase HerA-like ATPase
MHDFEKLGAFYLGRRYDMEAQTLTDEPVLYDSKDLTTHAAIIGMTGSGKTGLGIGILEEAALDHIPVIAIDPKGDMGNLLLTFPQLKPENFRPWINERTPDTGRVRGRSGCSLEKGPRRLGPDGQAHRAASEERRSCDLHARQQLGVTGIGAAFL